MKIVLNNTDEELEGYSEITISELLKVKRFTFKMLVIKLNDNAIKKDNYDTTIVREGDNVAVVHLISGG